MEVESLRSESMKGRSNWEGFLKADLKMEFRVSSPFEDAEESSEVACSTLVLEGGLKWGYVSLELETWALASESLTSCPEEPWWCEKIWSKISTTDVSKGVSKVFRSANVRFFIDITIRRILTIRKSKNVDRRWPWRLLKSCSFARFLMDSQDKDIINVFLQFHSSACGLSVSIL